MFDCELEVGSGEVLHQVTDVFLPCSPPVEITRRYASSNRNAGLFGFGWSDNMVKTASITSSFFETLDGIDGPTQANLDDCNGVDGPALGFFRDARTAPPGFAPQTPDDIRRRIRSGIRGELLAARFPDGTVECFYPPWAGQTRWTMILRRDSYGNTTTYELEHGWVRRMFGSDAREVRVDVDAGRVRTLSVHDVRAGGTRLSISTFEYDRDGNLAASVDQAGVRYEYQYVDHLLVRFSGPNGLVKHFAYEDDRRCIATWYRGRVRFRYLERDEVRRRVSVTDSFGHRTLLTFSEQGQLLEHVNALGQITRRLVDPAGQVIGSVGPDGSLDAAMPWIPESRTLLDAGDGAGLWRRQLDSKGRLVRIISPSGLTQQFTYNDSGDIVEATYANGGKIEYSYDERGEVRSLRDPEGYEIRRECSRDGRTVRFLDTKGLLFTQTFDAMDNLVTDVDPNGRETRYIYKAVDIVAEEVGPSDERTRYEYDDALNLRARIDPLGNAWLTESNALRQVTAEIDPEGGRTAYEYDLEGELAAVVDPRGDRMEIERDALGREIAVRYFDGRRTMYELDAKGRRASVMDARGIRTEFEYDDSDQFLRRTFADGSHEAYGRDPEGEYALLEWIPAEGSSALRRTMVYEHTPLGRIRKETGEEFESRVRMEPCLPTDVDTGLDRRGDPVHS